MNRVFGTIVLLFGLAGCVTNPLPDDFKGPTASIQDSASQAGRGKGLFFFVAEVDGQKVHNGLLRARSAAYGQGNYINAQPFSRKVPAQKMVLKLEGRYGYGAPIAAMFDQDSLLKVEATITVDARPDGRYVVQGVLNANSREIWLLDSATNARVGTTVDGGRR